MPIFAVNIAPRSVDGKLEITVQGAFTEQGQRQSAWPGPQNIASNADSGKTPLGNR